MNPVARTPAAAGPRLRNIHLQLVDALGAAIVAGRYPQDSQLPTEPQLAETYGASRLIIREAMKSLAARGLVSIRPRTGTRVQPRDQWNLFDPAVIGWHGQAPVDARFLADLMELRQAIEPVAARLAAERAGTAHLAEARDAFTGMEQAGERNAYIEADLRFHGAVLRGCGNQFIAQLDRALSAVWRASFEASSGAWGPDAVALALHRTLLEALESHAPRKAEKAAMSLIERAVVRIGEGAAK